MSAADTPLTQSILENENALLKKLFAEQQTATQFRLAAELEENVKKKIINWAKSFAAVVIALAAGLGFSTFTGARDAAIDNFVKLTGPALEREINDVINSTVRTSIENKASKGIDQASSANAEEFEKRIVALEKKLLPPENGLKPPSAAPPSDGAGRPSAGFVLRSFLRPAEGDTYLINTYRLNLRDRPNGSVLGRQVQNARVRITKTDGEWARVETITGPP